MIGQGTWGFGENRGRHHQEVDALREGFSHGMTLVDTAELYGAGESERVVGDAIADCRDSIFLITKIWPNHAGPLAMSRALEASLSRLRTGHGEMPVVSSGGSILHRSKCAMSRSRRGGMGQCRETAAE